MPTTGCPFLPHAWRFPGGTVPLSFQQKNSGQTLPSPRRTDHPLTERELNWLRHCADDLFSHPGESVVLLGDNHPELSGIVWKLNCLLGSMGTCIQLLKAPRPIPYGTLDELVRDIRGKKVEIVFYWMREIPCWIPGTVPDCRKP